MEELKEYLIGFEQRINQKFEQMENKVNKEISEIKSEMRENTQNLLNRQFVFEHEFGKKIDAIYDAVTLELDKNLEKSEKIRKLDARMDRNEVNFFDHEKRISILERN